MKLKLIDKRSKVCGSHKDMHLEQLYKLNLILAEQRRLKLRLGAVLNVLSFDTDLLIEILSILQEANRATAFKVKVFTQPMPTGISNPKELSMPTPLPPGAPLPEGSQYVLVVTPVGPLGRPATLNGTLEVTTNQAESVTVDAADPKNIIVKIPPPADRTQDILVHLKDSTDADPSADLTLDVDGSSTVENATGLNIAINTEPIV